MWKGKSEGRRLDSLAVVFCSPLQVLEGRQSGMELLAVGAVAPDVQSCDQGMPSVESVPISSVTAAHL